MKTADALGRLTVLLAAGGIDPARPAREDVAKVLAVMEQFASDRFEDIDPGSGGDAFLAQFGTFDFGTGEHFQVDLTRQFRFIDADGEFLYFDHLSCTFFYEPTDELRALGSGTLWSFDFDVGDFFAKARGLPGFNVRDAPVLLSVDYDEV